MAKAPNSARSASGFSIEVRRAKTVVEEGLRFTYVNSCSSAGGVVGRVVVEPQRFLGGGWSDADPKDIARFVLVCAVRTPDDEACGDG